MGATIRLQWVRYPHGCEVVEDWERIAPLLALPIADMPRPENGDPTPQWLSPVRAKGQTYVIQDTDDERVFLDLANVHSVDEVVAFTSKWGFLNEGSAANVQAFVKAITGRRGFERLDHPGGLFSDVIYVQRSADLMRRAIERVRSGKGVELDALLAKHHAQPDLRMRWAKLAGDSAPRFFLEPPDLFSFCVADLGQFVAEFRNCLGCGRLFATGKVGKPRKHCSDACKQSAYRKRKREAELRAPNVVRLRARAGR